MKIPGYKVHRKIGKGGMATVFLATQESFERKVALKIIADSAFGHQRLAERFISEAKIVASFSHPHIVPVYDVGRIEQFHYLSMDYLQNGDLSSWIQAGLEPKETEQIISQIAQALHYAHGKGYIHRDVKPDNILFREDNSAVLTDFGIAQPLSTNTNHNNTNARMVVGTPRYMSPEQVQGMAINARTDLYSLGVMFYQMLTKQLPYNAESHKELALKHINDPIPKLPFAVNRYQPLINKLLAKDPEQRFHSALQFIKALDDLDSHPDMAEISLSIADLKLVDENETPKNDLPQDTSNENTPYQNIPPLKKGLTTKEKSYRKLGLAKRYMLTGEIRSEEAQHFSVLFSQLTTRLLNWHSERGKQCGAIELYFSIDRLMESFVTEKINTLKNDNEHFSFLRKTKIHTTIVDLNNKPLH